MDLADLFNKYFLEPIALNQGYNFVNTLTYALLVVVFTWASFKILQRFKIKIDKKFTVSIFSLVFLGTAIRLLEEAGVSSSPLLVTPMIWIEAFAFVVIAFFISKFLEKKFKIPYYKTLTVLGIVLSIVPMSIVLSRIHNFQGMLTSLGLVVPAAILLYFVKWNTGNKFVTMAHLFDGTATFTAIQFFGFTEQHVVPRMLINYLSPVSFIIVKIIAVVGIMILLDKNSDDKNFNNFLKLIIAIIGFAPGMRDFFLLGLAS